MTSTGLHMFRTFAHREGSLECGSHAPAFTAGSTASGIQSASMACALQKCCASHWVTAFGHAIIFRAFPTFLVLAAVTVFAGNTGIEDTPGWRDEFKAMSSSWEVRGKPGVKSAVFKISQPADGDGSCLVMKADQASASLLMKLDTADLHQTPILRWRWRVTTFPRNADGRKADKDDQAIGIYVNAGSLFNQRSIAYRWETDTPVGAEGTVTYAGGLVKVKWFCLRNQKNGDGKTFLIEKRNVAEDFKKAFGFIPKKIGVGISCNSQYTASQAAAELDWIELVPRQTNTAAVPPAAH